MLLKNTILGKYSLFIFFFLLFENNFSISDIIKESENSINTIVEIKALDKVSAKSTTLKIRLGEEKKFQNLKIKPIKCKVSEFDDAPDTVAYLQVIDVTQKNNDKVFIFNGWTFSSSPSLRPFDHAVYDLWLVGCYNI